MLPWQPVSDTQVLENLKNGEFFVLRSRFYTYSAFCCSNGLCLRRVFELHQNVSTSNIWGGDGWGEICHVFALTNMLLYLPNNTSRVICLGNKH